MLLGATNRIEMKFAFKVKGMYHEKIGIVIDDFGDKILFHGSANETKNAIYPDLNFESIAVYRSWESGIYKDYALDFEKGFEDLWLGLDDSVYTIDMPSEIYQKISDQYRKNGDNLKEPFVNELDLESLIRKSANSNYPMIPKKLGGKKFEIYEHQSKALKSWFSHGGKGLFRLATGSGKTITAMYGVSTIFEKARSPRQMMLIVSVPYQALADQWVEELSLFNIKPIKCYVSRSLWESKLRDSINLLLSKAIEFFAVVVVNRTLNTDIFQSLISRVGSERIFFIGDECHRHANSNMRKVLPEASFKMGLSATPYFDIDEFEEVYENEDKEILTDYYGSVVAEYPLSQALSEGILTPYKYYLIEVRLSDEEMNEYRILSRDIARLMAVDKSKSNTALQNAIRRRNNIISNTENKLPVLDGLLKQSNFEDKSHTLFYVGEGKAIDPSLEDDITQLEVLSKVISQNGWNVSKFTSLENRSERVRIMDSFAKGDMDGLVSMRVLDEGIDIPQCKRAFILASSRNARQFIQRRGRILRKYPGKVYAEIYDFVVLPMGGAEEECFRNLVRKELARVMDFVKLADNRKDCESVAYEIGSEFDIELEEV
jgi:superfamily II DNA or RNA helicase